MHHKHCCFSLVFDYWASPVVHLLLLKGYEAKAKGRGTNNNFKQVFFKFLRADLQ